MLNTCKSLEQEGFDVTYLDVDEKGLVDCDKLEKAIKPTTILISIMTANNEIGTIEPIGEIGKIAKQRGIAFHTDAVQAIGNIKVDVKKMNIDMLSMSAHKFYGPKGIGALYVREGVDFNIEDHLVENDTTTPSKGFDKEALEFFRVTFKVPAVSTVVVPYKHDIDLADFNNTNYIKMRDNTNTLYIVVYKNEGQYLEKELEDWNNRKTISDQIKLAFYNKYHNIKENK